MFYFIIISYNEVIVCIVLWIDDHHSLVIFYMKELADETSLFIQRQRIELESYISRLLNRHVSVQRFVLFLDKALDLFWSILWENTCQRCQENSYVMRNTIIRLIGNVIA